jgi:hypothetical protein
MFVGAGGPGAPAAGRAAERATEAGEVAAPAVSSAANAVTDAVPDVLTASTIPIDRIATRGGKAYAPKVNPNPGSYRGITTRMREEAQRVGETYHGPGKYDVGHRTPLSQTPHMVEGPNGPQKVRVRLRAESVSPNRREGNAIARTNEMRRKAGLYTR